MGSDYWKNPIRGTDFLKRIINAIKLIIGISIHNASICHINLLRSNYLVDILLCRIMGCKVIGHIRSLSSQVKISTCTLRKCDAIICTSTAVEREIRKQISLKTIYTIYDPIEINKQSPENSLILNQFNFNSHKAFIISSVGILDPRKGHDTAIQIISEIIKKIPESVLLIIGGELSSKNEEKSRLTEMVKSLYIEEHVIFGGHIENIDQIYRISDIILALSKDGEAFGRVPLEAASNHRITIGTNIGATPEIIKHGKTGFLVNPDDNQSIIDHIIKIHHNKTLRKKMENAAYLYTKQFYPPNYAKAVCDIYDSLKR